VISDVGGNPAKKVEYDSFGSIISDTNPSMNIPFGFAGGLHDRHTNLVRFSARDYDPTLGRWTAKDPIDFAGGDTNLYEYVGGNPITKVDTSGLFPGPCGNEEHSWVPDYPYWVFDFTGPCQAHDDCYGCIGKKMGRSKSNCDFEFFKDMQIVCSKYILTPSLYTYCFTAAIIYYNAVFWGGNDAFEEARKEK